MLVKHNNCRTVKDKVFLDFNLEEKDKVVAGINSEFGDVWWFTHLLTQQKITGM